MGERIVAVLKQGRNAPVRVACQVAIIFAVTKGYLDKVEVKAVPEFEARLFAKLENGYEISDEEQKVLKRRDEWFEEQCLKRFPKRAYPSKFLVNRAQRYEYFISQNAPKCVIDEEGRRLAEEMILYYAVK